MTCYVSVRVIIFIQSFEMLSFLEPFHIPIALQWGIIHTHISLVVWSTISNAQMFPNQLVIMLTVRLILISHQALKNPDSARITSVRWQAPKGLVFIKINIKYYWLLTKQSFLPYIELTYFSIYLNKFCSFKWRSQQLFRKINVLKKTMCNTHF